MRQNGWPLPALMNGLVTPAGHDLPTTIQSPFGIGVPLRGWRPADEAPPISAAAPGGSLVGHVFRRDTPVPMQASVEFLRYRGGHDPERPRYGISSDREVRDWALTRLSQVFAAPRWPREVLAQQHRDARIPLRHERRQRVAQLVIDPCTTVTNHGVHLDFLWGRAQLGTTYVFREPHPTLGRIAVRKYWWCVYAADTAADLEIVLTFFVFGGLARLVALSPLFEYHSRVIEDAFAATIGNEMGPSGASISAAAPRVEYAVFDRVPAAEDLGIHYRLRQLVNWLAGYW